MKWIKELWGNWVYYTWVIAKRKCIMDEMIYGNSFLKEYWWGYKRICPLKMMDKEFIEKHIVKEYQKDTL